MPLVVSLSILLTVTAVPKTAHAGFFDFFSCRKAVEVIVTKRTAVKQCLGTCYFEAAVGQTEALLSSHLRSQISIDRPNLMAMLIKSRAERMLQEMPTLPIKQLTVPELLKEGFVDAVSNGNVSETISQFGRYGVVVISDRTQSKAYREQRLIEEMNIIAADVLWKVSRLHREKMRGANQENRYLLLNDRDLVKARVEALDEIEHKLNQLLVSSNTQYTRSGNTAYLFNVKIEKEMKLQFEENGELSAEATQLIKKQLDSKKEFTLSYTYLEKFMYSAKPDTTKLDGYAYALTDVVRSMDLSHYSHAVVVVGYKTNSKGQITHLITRDSYDWKPSSTPVAHRYLPIGIVSLSGSSEIKFYSVSDMRPF